MERKLNVILQCLCFGSFGCKIEIITIKYIYWECSQLVNNESVLFSSLKNLHC